VEEDELVAALGEYDGAAGAVKKTAKKKTASKKTA
jgi:hypothetical protein